MLSLLFFLSFLVIHVHVRSSNRTTMPDNSRTTNTSCSTLPPRCRTTRTRMVHLLRVDPVRPIVDIHTIHHMAVVVLEVGMWHSRITRNHIALPRKGYALPQLPASCTLSLILRGDSVIIGPWWCPWHFCIISG